MGTPLVDADLGAQATFLRLAQERAHKAHILRVELALLGLKESPPEVDAIRFNALVAIHQGDDSGDVVASPRPAPLEVVTHEADGHRGSFVPRRPNDGRRVRSDTHGRTLYASYLSRRAVHDVGRKGVAYPPRCPSSGREACHAPQHPAAGQKLGSAKSGRTFKWIALCHSGSFCVMVTSLCVRAKPSRSPHGNSRKTRPSPGSSVSGRELR